MISPKGDVLFENEFRMPPTDPTGEVFFVMTGKDYKWQIFDVANPTTPVSDDLYEGIMPFNEDVTIAVKDGECIKIIDKQGNEVKALDKVGEDIVYIACGFQDGLSIIVTDSGFGAVNTQGEVVVKPKYCYLSSFSDQVAIGMENKYRDEDKENRIISVINTRGETLFTFKATKYYDYGEFHKGLLSVCKKDDDEMRWGFIDKAGNEIVRPTAKNAMIGDWNDKVFVFSDGDQWGLKTIPNGDILIRCKYDKLEFADPDGTLLWAGEYSNSDHKWSLLNRKGKVLSNYTYKDHLSFIGNYCPVKVSDNEWTFIDRKGEEQNIKESISSIGGYRQNDYLFNQRTPLHLLLAMDIIDDLETLLSDVYSDPSPTNNAPSTDYSTSERLGDEGGLVGLFNVAASRLLYEYDLEGLTQSELRILRNSIYARHGYIFKSADLTAYFSRFSWYHPTLTDVNGQLSSIEKENIAFIKDHE